MFKVYEYLSALSARVPSKFPNVHQIPDCRKCPSALQVL